MGKSNYALNAPDSILAATRRAAKREGISLNQCINTALAEKVAALQAKEVFTQRAARADRARFLGVLERLSKEPPQPGDEMDAPESLEPVDAGLVQYIQSLTGGIEVDLDAPLPDDEE